LIFCEYKTHSRVNNYTIVCDILNHSQENFIIEIKQISWSNCFQQLISKSNPDPKICKYPAWYPILILSMLTSGVFILWKNNAESRRSQVWHSGSGPTFGLGVVFFDIICPESWPRSFFQVLVLVIALSVASLPPAVWCLLHYLWLLGNIKHLNMNSLPECLHIS